MAMVYKKIGGVEVGISDTYGDLSLFDRMEERQKQWEAIEREWMDKFKAAGAKLFHWDDGWHDREKESIRPCYPNFNLSPKVGDLVVLSNWAFTVIRWYEVKSVGGSGRYPVYYLTPLWIDEVRPLTRWERWFGARPTVQLHGERQD